jgi:hypothetical protein
MKAFPTEPSKLWSSTIGCAGALNGFGFELAIHRSESEPPIQQIYTNGAKSSDKFTPLGEVRGPDVHGGGLDAEDRPPDRIPVWCELPVHVHRESWGGGPGVPGYAIRCLFEQGGLFFIGLEDTTTPGASKIVVYNGAGYKDDLTGIRPPLAMGSWRNKLVVIFDGTAAHIRVRDAGSTSPGAWTTYALAGFSGSPPRTRCRSTARRRGSRAGAIASTRSTGRPSPSSGRLRGVITPAPPGSPPCLHHGVLHYGWNTTLTFGGRIGRYDADSTLNLFVDTYLNITAQQAGFTNLSAMQEYRNRIHAGGANQWVVATKENDVPGTVEKIAGGTIPSARFIVKQLVAFP